MSKTASTLARAMLFNLAQPQPHQSNLVLLQHLMNTGAMSEYTTVEGKTTFRQQLLKQMLPQPRRSDTFNDTFFESAAAHTLNTLMPGLFTTPYPVVPWIWVFLETLKKDAVRYDEKRGLIDTFVTQVISSMPENAPSLKEAFYFGLLISLNLESSLKAMTQRTSQLWTSLDDNGNFFIERTPSKSLWALACQNGLNPFALESGPGDPLWRHLLNKKTHSNTETPLNQGIEAWINETLNQDCGTPAQRDALILYRTATLIQSLNRPTRDYRVSDSESYRLQVLHDVPKAVLDDERNSIWKSFFVKEQFADPTRNTQWMETLASKDLTRRDVQIICLLLAGKEPVPGLSFQDKAVLDSENVQEALSHVMSKSSLPAFADEVKARTQALGLRLDLMGSVPEGEEKTFTKHRI